MNTMLEPMLKYTGRRIVCDKGRYPIQLEIPNWSNLTDDEIDRILHVASWEGEHMEDMADGFEGARSVLLKRGKISYENGIPLGTLQLSGVGYFDIKRFRGMRAVATSEGTMKPPETENYYEAYDFMEGEHATTTGFENGMIQGERPSYAPKGSYLESRAKNKIEKTIKAKGLGLRVFSIPSIEGYGRYLNLSHDDEHLSFIVFPVPLDSLRFTEYLTERFRKTFKEFCIYVGNLADLLGKGVRELHDRGKCHRQLHFSNFYYLDEDSKNPKLYVMDWGSMIDLKGIDAEKRAIDIRIPHQNLETIQEMMFTKMTLSEDGKLFLSLDSTNFLGRILSSYLGRNIDIMDKVGQFEKEWGEAEDVATIVETLKRELLYKRGKVGRNDPCPCGSNIKYKKCCGGH